MHIEAGVYYVVFVSSLMHGDCWRRGGKDSHLSWVTLVVGVELNSSGSGSKSCRRPVLREKRLGLADSGGGGS